MCVDILCWVDVGTPTVGHVTMGQRWVDVGKPTVGHITMGQRWADVRTPTPTIYQPCQQMANVGPT